MGRLEDPELGVSGGLLLGFVVGAGEFGRLLMEGGVLLGRTGAMLEVLELEGSIGGLLCWGGTKAVPLVDSWPWVALIA